MSQSCFSLGFLSQKSLWKLPTIRRYKGYLYWCVFGKQKVKFVTNRVVWRLGHVTCLSRESELRANCLARLEVLSYSAPASMTLQLPCMLHTCTSFGDLPAVSQLWDPIVRPCWVHILELFFTLSHILPLHESHLNTGFLNAELQENWHGIKPTEWLIKITLQSPPLAISWQNPKTNSKLNMWVGNSWTKLTHT